jgi:hypothetical protein
MGHDGVIWETVSGVRSAISLGWKSHISLNWTSNQHLISGKWSRTVHLMAFHNAQWLDGPRTSFYRAGHDQYIYIPAVCEDSDIG